MKKLFFAILCLLSGLLSEAQGITGFYISLRDPSIIISQSATGSPLFTISGVNTIVSQYSVNGFWQAFPSSRYDDMRRIYQVMCIDTNLAVALKTNYPQYFGNYELIYIPVPTGILRPDEELRSLVVFPQPAQHTLYVTNKSNNPLSALVIINSMGQRVFATRDIHVMNELPVKLLPAGQYYLYSLFADGHSDTRSFSVLH